MRVQGFKENKEEIRNSESLRKKEIFVLGDKPFKAPQDY
jgi:hypothetical protein